MKYKLGLFLIGIISICFVFSACSNEPSVETNQAESKRATKIAAKKNKAEQIKRKKMVRNSRKILKNLDIKPVPGLFLLKPKIIIS